MSASPFLTTREAICPPDLLARAQEIASPRVAIAAAGSALPMEAAFEATQAGIMEPVFVGDPGRIKAEADTLNWDISGFQVIEAEGEEGCATAAALACGEGRADVLMKGHLHSDTFMRAAVSRTAGLRTGARFVHIFHMTHPDGGKPLLISDAAVNVAPNMETRQDALRNMVHLLKTLGNARPKVAVLSATESVIDSVPSSVEADQIVAWASAEIKDADVAGPLAMDGIISPQAASIKKMKGPVPGYADAILVPDIVSGNAIFKSLVYLSGACAAGVVMGAKVPILLTSRADPAQARLASVALASIIANG